MPQPIPIIYTGLNAAAPDWKSFNRDAESRRSQLRQQRNQNAQFESLQNERQTKELLKNLDVDTLNSTNVGLMQQKTNITEGLTQGLTDMLKEAGGEPTTENQVSARLAMNEANQKIKGLNAQTANWKIDMKTFADNPEIYDHNKKDVIFGWNGSQDDPYTESRLDKVLREVPIEEVRASRFTKMRDPNTFYATSAIAGKEVDSKEKYDDIYFNEVNGKIVPDYKAQVGYLKATTAEEGKKGLNAEIAYDKEYNKAIAGKPQVKETYEQIALNTTGNKEDAKYIYELDNAGGAYFEKGEPVEVKAAKIEEPKPFKKDGKRVPLLTESRTVTYGDESFDNVFSLSKGVQLQEGVTIKGAREETDGEFTEAKDITYDNAVLIGANTDENGKTDKVFLRVRSDKFEETEKGDPIFTYQTFEPGTAEDIFKQMEISGVELDEGTKNYLKNNLFKRKKSDASSFKTIVAPANENKFLLNEFGIKGSKGVVAVKKAPVESYTFGGETYSIKELKKQYGEDFNPSDFEGFEKVK